MLRYVLACVTWMATYPYVAHARAQYGSKVNIIITIIIIIIAASIS